MKNVIMFFILTIAARAWAGEISGGGGPRAISSSDFSVTLPIDILGQVPDLGLPKVNVNETTYRRAAARLSVADTKTVPMKINDENVILKIKGKAIVDGENEAFQLFTEKVKAKLEK